jgi:DNA-directed RNA polymerase subunit H
MVTKKHLTLAPDHIYVPKHEVMTKKEAEEVLEKYHCKATELPLIFGTDPAIVGLGIKPGYDKDYQKKCNCRRKFLL